MQQPSVRAKGSRFLLTAAGAVIVIAGFKAASSLILPLMVAVFLAMISLPLLNWLQRMRVPTALAVPTTIMAALLVLGAIAVIIGGSIKDFTAQAPVYQERLTTISNDAQEWIAGLGVTLPEELGRSLTELVDPAKAFTMIAGTLKGVAGALSNLLLVLLTIVFILSEAAGFPAKLQRAFGTLESSARLEKIKGEVQRYLGFKTIISLATGLIVFIALTIIGVDFPLLWGMLAFLLNYVPTLGSIIAAVPPVLLAIVQLGPGHALATALVFVAVNVGLGNFLEPQLMGRQLGLSTLVVFLSLVFWGWVWGPVGMLLSVPLTMILKIMLENTEDLRWVAVLLDAPARNPRRLKRATPAGKD